MSRRNSSAEASVASGRRSSTISTRSGRSTRATWRPPPRPGFPRPDATRGQVSRYLEERLLSAEAGPLDPLIQEELRELRSAPLRIDGSDLWILGEEELSRFVSEFQLGLITVDKMREDRMARGPETPLLRANAAENADANPDAEAAGSIAAPPAHKSLIAQYVIAILGIGMAAIDLAASVTEHKDSYAKVAKYGVALLVNVLMALYMPETGKCARGLWAACVRWASRAR